MENVIRASKSEFGGSDMYIQICVTCATQFKSNGEITKERRARCRKCSGSFEGIGCPHCAIRKGDVCRVCEKQLQTVEKEEVKTEFGTLIEFE